MSWLVLIHCDSVILLSVIRVRVLIERNGWRARRGGCGGAVGGNQRPTITHLHGIVLNTIVKFHWRARSGCSILLARAKSEKQAAENP